MKRDDGVEFQTRLIEALMAEKEILGSYLRLAEEIGKASGNREGFRVDRRKITDIVEGADVKLSFHEFQALDTYLAQRGKGLSTLLDKPNLLKSLAGKGKVTFLLGAKPSKNTTNMSRWDVRSMAYLLRAMYRITMGLQFEIEDVLLRTRKQRTDTEVYATQEQVDLLRGDPWYRLIESRDAPSLVCLGSPRACHAAELMLAEMFGVPAFRPPHAASERRLPFFFLWSPDFGLPSSFALSGQSDRAASTAREHVTWGMEIEGDLIEIEQVSTTWTEYGVLAAQRRRTGQIWVVIAGLTGPATYATAKFVETFTAQLPSGNTGESSQVLYAFVEADIQRREDRRGELHQTGDNREVIDVRLFKGPKLWTPGDPEARASGAE